MIIYLATWFEDNNGDTLSNANISNRLVSYYKLATSPSLLNGLSEYIKTGRLQVLRGGKNDRKRETNKNVTARSTRSKFKRTR